MFTVLEQTVFFGGGLFWVFEYFLLLLFVTFYYKVNFKGHYDFFDL